MSRVLSLLILALAWIIVCVAASGCIAPAAPATMTGTGKEGGAVTIVSHPSGAEVSLDTIVRGHTPITLEAISAGNHTVRLALTGYESWSGSFFVGGTKNEMITADLIAQNICEPVTTAVSATFPRAAPEIHVEGYWEYPQGRVTTENPVPLVVHTEAFNTGSAGARAVSVSANFYYRGHMACWNTLSLGTLAVGGHVSRDSLVTCTLPLPISEDSLELKFENIVIQE
ncbi:PEGA domain-containing protein [Methanoregula formicica SMSP]|uniref:PEGA domain-containing protein n=2 Tax=Methanoregula formicica TaxID=882104 RepID=L0HG12_METFS|nr:PEGA domain-containing protein [Methanoregula formicica SMSP]